MIASLCCLVSTEVNVPWLFRENLRYQTLSQEDMNNEQLNWLSHAWSREKDEFDTFRVDGWDLCDTCLTNVYGIATTTWVRRKAQYRAGTRVWEHGSSGHAPRLTEQGLTSRSWMSDYFGSIGDYQPDTDKIHLPPSDKSDIHTELVVDLGDEAVSLQHFYFIWKTEFPDVQIPAQQRLGSCKKCETFHKKIIGEKDKLAREAIKQERRDHIKDVRAERKVYHEWRLKAKKHPDKYITIILDGMDQNKTNIPNFNTSNDRPYCRFSSSWCHQEGIRLLHHRLHKGD